MRCCSKKPRALERMGCLLLLFGCFSHNMAPSASVRPRLQLVRKEVSGWVLEVAITTNAPKGDSFKVVNQVRAAFVLPTREHSVCWLYCVCSVVRRMHHPPF